MTISPSTPRVTVCGFVFSIFRCYRRSAPFPRRLGGSTLCVRSDNPRAYVPRMRQERIAVVGDAAFVPRPHTGASTSKAAANAIALGEALLRRQLDIDAALQEWEPGQLDLGRRLEAQGIMLGNQSQFSI